MNFAKSRKINVNKFIFNETSQTTVPQQKQILYSVEILIVNKSYSQQQNNSSIQKSCVVYSILFPPESAEIYLNV